MADNNGTTWTFLSNHAHVLICIAGNGDLRLRDIAALVGVTERAVFAIVNDLEEGGYLRRIREGRRNRYEIDAGGHLRHPLEAHHTVEDMLSALGTTPPSVRR